MTFVAVATLLLHYLSNAFKNTEDHGLVKNLYGCVVERTDKGDAYNSVHNLL